MKKTFTAFFCILLIFSSFAEVFAFEIKYYSATAPEITDTSFSDESGNRCYTVSYTSERDSIEELRELLYGTALEGYGSEGALLSSPEAYLCSRTFNYCEISTDGESWFLLKKAEEELTFSLFDDILPVLSENGIDLSALTDGFDFYVRLVTASENHTDKAAATVFAFAQGEGTVLSAPPFGYIHCKLPEDAVFTQTLPVYYSEELTEDIILSSPTRKGYIFDGWSINGDTRVDRIPKDAAGVTLTAHWIPMVYEINYKLTTNIEYNFGRADNSDNPVSYTVGIAQPIYDIKPPVAGYTFDGWYLTEDFSGERVTEIPAGETGDKILYAKWLSYEEIEIAKREAREKFMTDNKYGDPDGDGSITAADARLVLRTAVGLESQPYEILKRMDYFNTNTVSSMNARTTLRIAVGLDSLYDILLENGVFPE